VRRADLFEHKPLAGWIDDPYGRQNVVPDRLAIWATSRGRRTQVLVSVPDNCPTTIPRDVGRAYSFLGRLGAVDKLAPHPPRLPRGLVRNDVDPVASRHPGRHRDPVVQCADDRRVLARSLPDVQRRAGRVRHDAGLGAHAPREEGNEKQRGYENKSNVPVWNFANRHAIPLRAVVSADRRGRAA